MNTCSIICYFGYTICWWIHVTEVYFYLCVGVFSANGYRWSPQGEEAYIGIK